MNKTKKIIISLGIALVLLVITNIVINKGFSETIVQIPIAARDIKKGEKLLDVIDWLEVSLTSKSKALCENVMKTSDITDSLVASEAITKGQMIISELAVKEGELIGALDNKSQYIAIPISGASYSVGYQIKKKDIVTVYYTSKTKTVDAVIKGKEKIYSNNTSDGFVTCKLLENVQIVSTINNIGDETKKGETTSIVIQTTPQDAMLIANLKAQGTFDVVLVT